MAAERLPMRKLREVIRLKLQGGQSGRAIARSCGLSPSTVGEYLGRVTVAGLAWPLAPELDDDEALERLLFPDEGHPVPNRDLEVVRDNHWLAPFSTGATSRAYLVQWIHGMEGVTPPASEFEVHRRSTKRARTIEQRDRM